MADEYSVKVKVQPVLASNYKQQIQSQLKASSTSLTIKSVKIQSFNAAKAIQTLKSQIQSQLKNFTITVPGVKSSASGSSAGSSAIKQRTAQYQAAEVRLNSYAASYKSLLKTMSSGGASMNTGSMKKLIDSYQQIISLRGRLASGDDVALSGILSGNNKHVQNGAWLLLMLQWHISCPALLQRAHLEFGSPRSFAEGCYTIVLHS